MPHQAQNEHDSGYSIQDFSPVPNTCPVCNSKITPRQIGLFLNIVKSRTNPTEELEAVYRCANKDCMSIFIAYYGRQQGTSIYHLIKTKPKNFNRKIFSETIKHISPDFEKIYNESLQAEELELMNICGGGYRKSLEFLIKDYLLNKTEKPEEKENIKGELLGKSISDRIEDTRIKAVAKRATWLGNDEIHYVRKWETKDLQDLKKLIDLTVHWMEAESLTNDLLNEMPETTKAS